MGCSKPDPVKDATWQEWEGLKERADKMQIELADVKRGATTDPDLRTYLAKISPYIRDAEDQAKAE